MGRINHDLSQDRWAASTCLSAKNFFLNSITLRLFLHVLKSPLIFLTDSVSASLSLQSNYTRSIGIKKCVRKGNKHSRTWKLSREKWHFLPGSIICSKSEVIISALLISWALILLRRIYSSHMAIQKSCFLPRASPDIITSLEWSELACWLAVAKTLRAHWLSASVNVGCHVAGTL